jgi:electron transfer flavoprotein alpha subunit
MQLCTLVLAEHNGGKLQPTTLHTLAAASQLGGPITVLVAGDSDSATSVAQAVSSIEGVAGVLTAAHPCLTHSLAEPVAGLVRAVQRK